VRESAPLIDRFRPLKVTGEIIRGLATTGAFMTHHLLDIYHPWLRRGLPCLSSQKHVWVRNTYVAVPRFLWLP